jgi:hypothetical protein
MAAGAVELAKPVAVTHCDFPFDSLGLCDLIGIVVIVSPAKAGAQSFDPGLRRDDDANYRVVTS